MAKQKHSQAEDESNQAGEELTGNGSHSTTECQYEAEQGRPTTGMGNQYAGFTDQRGWICTDLVRGLVGGITLNVPFDADASSVAEKIVAIAEEVEMKMRQRKWLDEAVEAPEAPTAKE